MDLHHAELMAMELLRGHGLANWHFRWHGRKRVLGTCIHSHKCIYLSRHYTALNGEQEVRDTLLHEVSHALVGPAHGHDMVWKSKAIELGAKPSRCTDNVIIPHNFEYECPNCKSHYPAVRRWRIEKACMHCCTKYNGGVYDSKYKLYLTPQYRPRASAVHNIVLI